jgi:thiol-disulfide isomerase/thioredoxin
MAAPAAIVALALACAASRVPSNARTTVLSLTQLRCATCAEGLAKTLAARPGVYKATFDKRRAEITVVAVPDFDPLPDATAAASEEEFKVEVGAGKGSYVPWSKPPENADVALVTKDGEDVPDLSTLLAKGKVTLVDFSATWCEPCRDLDAHLMKELSSHPLLAYRKLDIGDWDTPLARRYLGRVPELPYVIVFGKAGERIDAIAGLNLPRIDAAIARAEK